MTQYPDPIQWLDTCNVEIETVNPTAPLDVQTGAHPITITMVKKTHILTQIFTKKQLQLLLEYNQKYKIKSHEWSKLTADKKSLLTIKYRQCGAATRTKIALRGTYKTDCQARNIINFLKQVHTIFFGSDNGGLFSNGTRMSCQ